MAASKVSSRATGSPTRGLFVNDIQVVGEQASVIAAAANDANANVNAVVQTVNDVLAALKTHGLIASA